MVATLRILTATALIVTALPVSVLAGSFPEPGAQSAVVSRDADQPQGQNGGAETPGPMDVFDDIEQGWISRNVDLILRHFGAQKVAISIDGTGPSGGSFSKSQSYYLLKDLFRFTVTKKFEFVQFRKSSEDGSQSFAIAERQYQRRDDGRLIKDKVYVSLHLERDGDRERWVVDEIKSIR